MLIIPSLPNFYLLFFLCFMFWFNGNGWQQFVWNDFSEEYVSTDRKHTYYPSVIINDHLYELKISDLPAIPYFPVNSFYEWTEFRFYGLRSATAYVLVFDLSNIDTFQYIRTLRDQIAESRDIRNVPLLVVGNKQDLLVTTNSSATNCQGNNSSCTTGHLSSNTSTVPAIGFSNSERDKRRDIMNLVKKHWKCGYVECSARYNWRVVAVFKELMKTIDVMETAGAGTQGYKEVCSPMIDNIHEALDRNKCSILWLIFPVVNNGRIHVNSNSSVNKSILTILIKLYFRKTLRILCNS